MAPRRIQATGNASGLGSSVKSPMSKSVEEAMSRAVQVAASAGITDPVKIKALMLKAREKAMLSV